MLTQEDEETVAIKPKAEPKKEEVKKKPEKPEKTEAEKAEEARKLAEAKAERERREAEGLLERVAGAFGKGAQMGSEGTTEGTGLCRECPPGNPPGRQSSRNGRLRELSLGGSIGQGGLPHPR